MERPETRYTKTGDRLFIAYQVIGEGPPDIVLPCGFIDVVWEDPSYAHFLTRLARIGRLILFDGRGLGASDPVPLDESPTPEQWFSEDLPVVMDAAGSTSASIVCVGVNGFIGLFCAASLPDRTDSLVLIDSFAGRVSDINAKQAVGTREEGEELGRLFLEAWGTGAMAYALAPSRSRDETFRRWCARFERENASRAMVQPLGRWGLGFDVTALLSCIHLPVLVLHHESGPFIPREHGARLAEGISNARLVVFPGTDTFPFAASADDLMDDIEEFITGDRPMREANRMFATILFTDIVD